MGKVSAGVDETLSVACPRQSSGGAPTADELTDHPRAGHLGASVADAGQVDQARPVVGRLLQRGYRHPTLLSAWAAASP